MISLDEHRINGSGVDIVPSRTLLERDPERSWVITAS